MLITKLITGLWPKNEVPVRLVKTSRFPLQFKVTSELRAEPMKAKKKIDPALIRMKEEKKRKRIEKMIKKHLKEEKQLKPVEELGTVNSSLKEERKRVVGTSEDIAENRILILKEWSKIKNTETISDIKLLKRITYAQKKALDELKLESNTLYEAAVQIDQKLIPLKYVGPVETPPIQEYPLQDGEYVDLTRKWT